MARYQSKVAILIILTFGLLLVALVLPKFVSGGLVRSLFFAEKTVRAQGESTEDSAIKDLTLKLARLGEVEKENDRLRQLLKFYSTRKYTFVLAYISSHDNLNANLLTLDVGTAEGVNIDQPVVVDEGVLIGKIVKVQEHKALVELLTSDFSKVAASTTETNETSGLLVGTLGNSLRLQYIPNASPIEKNQLVITSGLENQVPRGLVIGTIEKVESTDSDVFKYAEVKPVVNYQRYFLVSVITQ